MNQASEGSLSDRVYVGFHSNAGGGRGTVGLHNTANGGATPNQLLLAQLLGKEVNDDLVDQNGQYEHNWNDRGNNVTYQASFNYGEINNSIINNEFDATILEVAFHDNQLDAELMRDGDVRDAVSQATVQGLIRYFNSVDGGATPLTMPPSEVSGVRAEVAGSDSVTVSWVPPAANAYNGSPATGFRIYGSTNGYGFDGGTYVAGGASTSYTFTNLDPAEGAYYFRVVAENSAGAAPASEVVAAIPQAGPKDILIVNGFDRLSRQQNPVQAGAERIWTRSINSYDYAVQLASAIEANAPDLVVNTTSNEALIAGNVQLADYTAVFWILGEESTLDSTFDASEQSLVANYLASGGQLFVSGSEIGWDLDSQNNGRTFYNDTLRADFVADDANSYNAQGAGGSIFEGLSFSFDNGSQFYNVDVPDVITPLGGATAALNYVGGSGGVAGIQYDSGANTKLVHVAFPVETITDASVRTTLIGRVLDFFSFDVTQTDLDVILDNDDGPAVYSETGAWNTSTAPGYNGGTYRFSLTGLPATATWNFYTPFAGEGEVFAQYQSGSNRASNSVYTITTGTGTEQVSLDQRDNNFTWVSLGSFSFTAGTNQITLDALNSTGGSVVIADVLRVVLPVPATETADFDSDGDVDGFDFLAWQRGFGQANPALADGDANADNAVDETDLGIWQTQYGAVPVLASVQASDSPAFAVALVSAEPSPDALTGIAQFWHTTQPSAIRAEFTPAERTELAARFDEPTPADRLFPADDAGTLYSELAQDSEQTAESDQITLEEAFAEIGLDEF